MSVPCCRDTSLQQALDTFWKNGSIELNKTPRTHGSKTTSEKINKKPKPHRNTHTYTHTGLETTKLLSWSSQARAQSNPEFVAGHQTRLFMKLDRAWGVWQRERGKTCRVQTCKLRRTDSSLQPLPKGASAKYWREWIMQSIVVYFILGLNLDQFVEISFHFEFFL